MAYDRLKLLDTINRFVGVIDGQCFVILLFCCYFFVHLYHILCTVPFIKLCNFK